MNSSVATLDREASVLGLPLDVYIKDCVILSNCPFLNRGFRRLLEIKNYCALDMVFLVISPYIDITIGSQKDGTMTGIHHMRSEIVSSALSQSYGRGWSVAELEEVCKVVYALKHKDEHMLLTVSTFGLFTVKFHLLDHLA